MPFDELDVTDEEFAARLPDALNATADRFPAPSADLVPSAVQRGRRLRLVRNAQVGGGAVLALAALGGVLAGTGVLGAAPGVRHDVLPAASSATPSAVPTPSASVTEQDMIRTLERLLPPGGTVSRAAGRGSAAAGVDGSPFAQLTYTDAHGGTSGIDIDIARPGPWNAQQDGCLPVEVRPYDQCAVRTLPDGATAVEDKSYTYPSGHTGQRRWTSDVWTVGGAHLSVEEFGGGGEKGSTSSADPVLSLARLTAIADSLSWAKAIAAVPAPRSYVTPTTTPGGAAGGAGAGAGSHPGPALSGAKMWSALRALVPSRYVLTSPNVQDGLVQAVLDDGHGRNMIEVDDQRGMADKSLITYMACQPDESDCTSHTLPDGTIVKTYTQTGTSGAVSRIFDTLHQDGHRVLVRETNSYSENGPVTRPAPALSTAQLQAIAFSDKWGS
jgi:hypothetical protein